MRKEHYIGKGVKVYISKDSHEAANKFRSFTYGIVKDVTFQPSERSESNEPFTIEVFKVEPVEGEIEVEFYRDAWKIDFTRKPKIITIYNEPPCRYCRRQGDHALTCEVFRE